MGSQRFGAGLLQLRRMLLEEIEDLQAELKEKPLNLHTAAASFHIERGQEQQSWQPWQAEEVDHRGPD